MKTCKECGEDKPLSDYYLKNGKPTPQCKPCKREYQKKYTKDKKTQRDYDLMRKFGILQSDYDRMLAEQDGKCWVPSCTTGEPGLGRKHYAVDHNHETGEVRRLLCHHCNMALGQAKDNPAILRELADYLEEHGHYG